MTKTTKKVPSVSQSGLHYWAELVDDTTPKTWSVVSQADGFPATEAWDDWFLHKQHAEEIAQKLAQGTL
jgi:hypothetical protein